MEEQKYTDYLIECGNPEAFDRTINSMGAAMLKQNADNSYPKTAEGYYTMRIIGDPGYIVFAIKNQGYGKVVNKLES